MKAWICVNEELLDSILVEFEVKQSDLFTLTLFVIYFAMVFLRAFKDIEVGVYVRYCTTGKLYNFHQFDAVTEMFIVLIRDLLYAHNCNLITHLVADMQLLMDCFSTACTEFCLSAFRKQ